MAGSLPSFQITNDVGNLSFFRCLVCDRTNMSFASLYSHTREKHGEHMPYRAENVVEARYHKCQICLKIVLCDSYKISKHVRSHGISRQNYNENYVLKNGGRVVNCFQEYLQNNRQVILSSRNHLNKTMIQGNSKNSLIVPSDLSSESEESDYETWLFHARLIFSYQTLKY